MKPSLTPKQKRLLDYLQAHIAETGTSPSLRQAAQDMGVSHTAISQTLKILEKKGFIKREGPYQRAIYLINSNYQAGSQAGHQTGYRSERRLAGIHRWKEVPVIGRVTAGLPMYAQQEWDGSIVIDADLYKGDNLFALHVKGDSMINVGILHQDLVICEPRQYAANGEIIVALIHNEEATIKRFFVHSDHIILQPENPAYDPMRYGFDEVMVQGKVIGIHRGPEVMQRL